MSISNVFVKMHTGDPGAAGTANAATNATRKALSVGDQLDSQYRLVQDTVISYTGGEVTATETYAWVSFWTAVSGGTHLGNEDIANQAATAAAPLNIAAGVITVSSTAVIDYVLRGAVASGHTAAWRRFRNWMGALRANTARAQRAKFATQPAQKI